MSLDAGLTSAGTGRWAAYRECGESKCLDAAAAKAEATGRKLLAKSLRLLLAERESPRPPPKTRKRIAESIRRLSPEEFRELLRQLLREIEKGGGA